jgi:hypothetical protein
VLLLVGAFVTVCKDGALVGAFVIESLLGTFVPVGVPVVTPLIHADVQVDFALQ